MPALRSLQRFTVSLYYDMLFFVYVNYYGLFISHSPYQVSLRRFTSGVPQKCLFVMNNRFIYIFLRQFCTSIHLKFSCTTFPIKFIFKLPLKEFFYCWHWQLPWNVCFDYHSEILKYQTVISPFDKITIALTSNSLVVHIINKLVKQSICIQYW